jgi:hypothetical protein
MNNRKDNLYEWFSYPIMVIVEFILIAIMFGVVL